MITFDEYMGFSDSKKDQEKKPGKIKQFFKKHGKKLAIGAAIAASAVGAGLGGKKLYDMWKANHIPKFKPSTPKTTASYVTKTKNGIPIKTQREAGLKGTNAITETKNGKNYITANTHTGISPQMAKELEATKNKVMKNANESDVLRRLVVQARTKGSTKKEQREWLVKHVRGLTKGTANADLVLAQAQRML